MEIAKHTIIRFTVLALLCFALLSANASIRQLTLLLLSGVISGVYHGLYTLSLWRKDDKDKHKDRQNIPYEVNTLWLHILCGIIASICLYLIVSKTTLTQNFSIVDILLFIIVLVGYAGLLPRTMWFFSYSGKLDK